MLLQLISVAWALQIERPSLYDGDIRRLIGDAHTNGEASVALSADVRKYIVDSIPGGDMIMMNVSVAGNSRKGIKYSHTIDDQLYYWMYEDPSAPYYQEFENVGDDWGTWVDLPWGFRFSLYGAKYKQVPEESVFSQIWICSNGFVSFDLSNSTNPHSYDIPSSSSPNAVVAALWTDLEIDEQSKIITMKSNVGPSFVVIWKNARVKSDNQRLTFALALQAYQYEGCDQPLGCPIYIAYQNVTPINDYFTYGVEDLEGREGFGQCLWGGQLENLNGTTRILYQESSNYFIKRLTLEFKDQNHNQSRYYFPMPESLIRGSNMKTKTDPPPEPDPNMTFLKNALKTGALLFAVGGYLMEMSVFWYTAPVSAILLYDAWAELWAKYQYNNIEWLELKDDNKHPGIESAYVKVPTSSDIITDASLCAGFYWVLDSPYTESHELTITATLTYYEEYPENEKNVTTSVNIKIGPDNNDSFDTAKRIYEGDHGNDPMLWLGGYDTKDYYEIYLKSQQWIMVQMMPPPGVGDFDLYLHNPDRSLKKWSNKTGDSQESIILKADSTGYWFIEVRWVLGLGFYNMSVDISGGGGSGCPFVYVWNGQKYVTDNNILPTSEANNGADVKDYYTLEQTLVSMYQGDQFSLYSLQIREFENEHSYIDQTKLIAVDHDSGVNIAVTPDGEILTYREPEPPIYCVDNNGINRLSEILQMDGDVSNPTTYYYGEAGDYLILNFGQVNGENAKLILRDDMKCIICCIEVQVLDADGEWQTVSLVAPRDRWAIEAVDLSEHVTKNRELLVRLFWTSPHRLDYIGLDTTPQESFAIHYANLAFAVHSDEGNVRWKLLTSDNVYAELTPGQHITLVFKLPNDPNGERIFILYTEGHYHTISG